MTRSLVLIVLGLSFTACKPATACTDVGIPAIELAIRDAQSGVPIATSSTVIASRRGGATDTLHVSSSLPGNYLLEIGLASGTYDLVVRHPGYQDLSLFDIKVSTANDGCHPVTTSVEARLQAAP